MPRRFLLTGLLIYLQHCPAFANDASWMRFCLGEWEWDTIYVLSLKSFHATGTKFMITMHIDSSTVEFRTYLSECFKGMDTFLQAVCSPLYDGVFNEVCNRLQSKDNHYKGVSDGFLFHTLNAWMATVFKQLRSLIRKDGSLMGPPNCRKFIVEQMAKPLAQLEKVVNGDTKLERDFFKMQAPRLQWLASETPVTRTLHLRLMVEPLADRLVTLPRQQATRRKSITPICVFSTSRAR